jgi:hypothetical protein
MLDQILKKFDNKFNKIFNFPVVVRGVLEKDYELLNTDNATQIKDFVTQTYNQARKETIENVLKCKPELKISPNYLKLDEVHNKCEKQNMLINKGFNEGIKTFEQNIKTLIK